MLGHWWLGQEQWQPRHSWDTVESKGGQNQVPSALLFAHNILFLRVFHIINFILSIITGLQIPWGQETHWPHLPVKPKPVMKPGTSQVSNRYF